MRIAFLTYEFPPRINGGAGVYSENLVDGLVRTGNEVVVMTPNFAAERPQRSDAYRLMEIASVKDRFLSWSHFCLRALKWIEHRGPGERFDVVHFNTLGQLGLRDRRKGPAYLATAHHLVGEVAQRQNLTIQARLRDLKGENGYLIPWVEHYGTRLCDRFVAVSEGTRSSLQRRYSVPPERVDVIWNGIDGRHIPALSGKRSDLKAHFGLPDLPVLLFVGRVDDPRKGLDHLIRSLAKAPQGDRCHIFAVGKGDAAKLQNLAKQYRLEGRLHAPGFLGPEDLWRAYAMCDAYVCPSLLEGFGLTVIEALCAGRPVVSTRVGIVNELDHPLLRKVDIGDETGMAGEMMRAVDQASGSDEVVPIAIDGRYSWERCVYQTLSSYQRAMELRG
jgi:starch synthase